MCVFTADCMFTLGKVENGYRLSQCESVRGTAKLVSGFGVSFAYYSEHQHAACYSKNLVHFVNPYMRQ